MQDDVDILVVTDSRIDEAFPHDHFLIDKLANEFDQLKLLVQDDVDIYVITETRIDETFPHDHFLIDNFAKLYILDRDRNGVGVLIYIREDIPSKPLKINRGIETFLQRLQKF